MSDVTGIIQKIVFHRDDFYILGIKPLIGNVIVDEKFGTFTAKGELPYPVNENELITLSLKETMHQQYGRGYDIQRISAEYPQNDYDQIQLLSQILKEFGTANDRQIFNSVKNQTQLKESHDESLDKSLDESLDIFDVESEFDLPFLITKNPKTELKPNTHPKSDNHVTSFPEKDPYTVFLDMGFSQHVEGILVQLTAPDMYRKWAENYNLTEEELTDLSDCSKLVFASYDDLDNNIAQKLHSTPIKASTILHICQSRQLLGETTISRDDPYLFDLSLRDVVLENMYDGDTRLNAQVIMKQVMINRGMKNPNTYHTLFNNRPDNSLISVIDGDILLSSEYEKELLISRVLKLETKYNNIHEKSFNNYLNTQNITLTNEQMQFCTNVFTNQINTLTGGAGTGKSFTLGTLVQYLSSVGCSIACTAPTAQAAKVLKDYTQHDSSTIHSFLMSESEPQYLIVDESSMLDNSLASQIIQYIETTGSILILSGDVSQLPPIGYGAPYRDIMNNITSHIELTKIFRQKDAELINVLTQARHGEFNITPTSDWQSYGSRVLYKHYSVVEDTLDVILATIKEKGLSNVGIISPVNKVVNQLNTNIQDSLNPKEKVAETKTRKYGKNDPIILLQNKQYAVVDNLDHAQKAGGFFKDSPITYIFHPTFKFKTIRAYNGDRGKVIEILNRHQFIVELDDYTDSLGNPIQIIFDTADGRDELTSSQVTLGYSLTVHKSQGSQYETVIFVCPYTRPQMTSIPMIYTALSRAKSNIIILSQGRFSNMNVYRHTLLSGKIVESDLN